MGATQVPGGDLFEYLKDDIEIVYSHIDHLKNMTQYNQHAPARHYAYPQYKVII